MKRSLPSHSAFSWSETVACSVLDAWLIYKGLYNLMFSKYTKCLLYGSVAECQQVKTYSSSVETIQPLSDLWTVPAQFFFPFWRDNTTFGRLMVSSLTPGTPLYLIDNMWQGGELAKGKWQPSWQTVVTDKTAENRLIGEANQTKFYESQLVTDLSSAKQNSFVSIPAKADSPVSNFIAITLL